MHKGCTVRWSFAQIGLLIICVFHVIQAVIGLIIEPSFATGPNAPTVQLLGMDYNGWHAVAGLALFAQAWCSRRGSPGRCFICSSPP